MISSPNGALLQLIDATKTYRRGDETVRAVDHVNLSIPSGHFAAIVGPSGAGKSTLLHLVGALDRPTSGRILLEGRDIAKMSSRDITIIRRRRIGFVFQFFNLLPNLATWHNIALPLLIDGVAPPKARKRAYQLGERLGIGHRMEARAGLLSGGEMQRTAIARALVADPPLLLADEPTGNLDVHTGREVLEVLRWLVRSDGRTVVMVTHDQTAAAMCDMVIRIVDGQLVTSGPELGASAAR